MKRAPRSLQHHVLYRKYNGQDSEISALLGKCGLKANTVTTGALAAGAVNTAQLAAGAATIDKLAVRSSQTVNVDPFYEDASAWIAPNITRVAAPAGGVGPWWLQAAAPGTNVTFPNNRSPIDPTKSYLLEGWLARLTPTGNGKSFFTVNFFTANGTPVASGTGWPGLVGGNHYFPSLSTIPTQTPARHTITIGPNGTAAIPANAAFISFGFFWNYESTIPTTGLVGPIRMTEMAAGEAIIDGTLQARHVTAGEFITNTAQIKDAIITDAKVASLSAAKLKAGTALVGSITVNGRALATVAASDAYIENMGNAAHWGNYVGVAPTFVTSPDAKVGTDVLQSNGYCWAYGNQPVIFDPNKLYRVTAIVRRSGANAGGMLYLGLVGYAENGTTLVNTSGSNTPSNQHYCVAAAVPQTTLNLNEWTEFVGYVKGVSAVGSGGVGILEAPSKMHALVKKIAPLLILNYNTGTTPMQVDYFRIEVVNEDAAAIVNAGVTNINGGKIETNTLEASAIKTSSFSAAGLAVFDGQLKSSDFVAGAEGWEINDDGSAEFNSLKVRRDMIVDGAISRRAILPGGFSVSIAPGTWTALSPRIITATAYFDPAPYDHDTHPTNTSLMTFNCVCKPGSIHGGVLSLLFQREISGVWTTEWFRDIVLPTAEQPFHVMLRAVGGIFADPIGAGEWRVGAYVSYGSVAWVDVSGVMCTFEQINR